MKVGPTEIAGIRLLAPVLLFDDRGWFSETYRMDLLAEAGITDIFVQDNQSFSSRAGTVRGIHFQLPPFAQAKLVRVLAGAILDVAVDLRRSSPSYGKHIAIRLDAEKGEQLFIPAGFGHGFCTLEADTMVSYKASAYYSREHERSIAFDDPDLGIQWPVQDHAVIISDKDRMSPRLASASQLFD